MGRDLRRKMLMKGQEPKVLGFQAMKMGQSMEGSMVSMLMCLISERSMERRDQGAWIRGRPHRVEVVWWRRFSGWPKWVRLTHEMNEKEGGNGEANNISHEGVILGAWMPWQFGRKVVKYHGKREDVDKAF